MTGDVGFNLDAGMDTSLDVTQVTRLRIILVNSINQGLGELHITSCLVLDLYYSARAQDRFRLAAPMTSEMNLLASFGVRVE